MEPTTVMIRPGEVSDIPRLLELIQELATFEREPHAVKATQASMLRDGFGDNPVFGSFVAELSQQVVGMAIYYYRYSTWRGRCLYLEDLVVTESARGRGIGKKLFEQTVSKAKQENCQGLFWQVLDWNQPAIDFYLQYGAQIESQWLTCYLTKQQLDAWDV
ncbi:MAG TPA: GNAT family N-acetyltransferase [Pirellulaceae bacterium]|nr:GNAT family N-acetyltransferase [Pirellulaceae bacterium]